MFDCQPSLDFKTAHLHVKGRGKVVQFYPQFIMPHNGSLMFTPTIQRESRMFLGWRPYFNRIWPIAVDKLAFKAFCREHSLLTPKLFARLQDVDTDVVLKRARASFGLGVSPPRIGNEIVRVAGALAEGEYYEEFKRGTLAKIFYVNEKPVAVESMEMPSVVGDGRSTLRDLILALLPRRGEPDWGMCSGIAHYQGLTLDSIVEDGRRVLAEIKYLSMLHAPTLHNVNSIDALRGTATLAQLERAGQVFIQGVPEFYRELITYTVDAVVDSSGQAWFLEMNCNSVAHPDSYASMFARIFGPAAGVSVQWSAFSPSYTAAAAQ